MKDGEQIRSLVVDAYQYAFPLVIMDCTFRQATNVPDADRVPMRAPVNRFAHVRAYPPAEAKDVVRLNFDTLYSLAWVDLRDGPVLLTVPDAPERYHLTPMLDMWTDVFAVPGTRTTDGRGGEYLLTHGEASGRAPEGAGLIRSPTPVLWIIGRTQTNGASDYEAVHRVQDQYALSTLGGGGGDGTETGGVDPSVDDRTPPQGQVWSMGGAEFFARFAELLAVHPPHYNDYPILSRIERLGLRPGESFAPPPEVEAELDPGVEEAKADIVSAVTDGTTGVQRNGWQWMQQGSGSYGTDYRLRAMVAYAGLGCNLREDALYPNRATDADGQRLSGEHRYTLRFEPGALPPADAFWSLTMYDEEGFQVPNEIDRFAIGDRDPLLYGEDGSLVLHVQAENPGPEREANWLPAPAGSFQLTMRLYSPTVAALRAGIELPAPVRA